MRLQTPVLSALIALTALPVGASASPLRWPHGWQTNPMHDPRALGTRPAEFAGDLARGVAGLNGIAAGTGQLEPAHGYFGVMSRADWQRWAFKHTDHHLRQFGL